MENIKLNFAHLCDMAFLSQEGKLNIIGIFKTIFAQTFPTTHPKLSVVVSFLVNDKSKGNHNVKIKMIKRGESKSIMPDLSFNFEVKDLSVNQKGEMNFIADAAGIKFDTTGEYKIIILLDNAEIKRIPFAVNSIDNINLIH